MERPKILFVDDELGILEGLRLALRKERGEWDMEFALGGPPAILSMERSPADVVVTDMRMPGMDGAQLLTVIKLRWPSATRLVLSGHAESEAVVRAMSVAHQYLTKPLETDLLKVVVHRALKMQKLLHRPELLQLAGRVGDLPSLPGTYSRLVKVTQDNHSSVKQIADVVASDPQVSAKILQLVNSAYYGVSKQVGSIGTAVSLLGPHVLLGMALSGSILDRATQIDGVQKIMHGLQEYALQCCEWTGQLLPDGKIRDEAITTALIHDLGTLLLAMADPVIFSEVHKKSGKLPIQDIQLEDRAFGATHAELGAYLFGLWGLPLNMVEAIACHHNPRLVQEGDVALLATLHCSDVLTLCAAHGGDPLRLADMDVVERGGLMGTFTQLSKNLCAAPTPLEEP